MAIYDRRIYKASPVFLQSAAMTAQGLASQLIRRGPTFRRLLGELEESQWSSSEEFRALQDERLAALIRHCYEKVPYYRRVMTERRLTPDDVRTAEDLHRMPFLTKEIVRTEGKNLLREDLGRLGVYRSKTSGTTGTPLQLVRDAHSINIESAFIWRSWRDAGMQLGDRRATMRGEFVVPPDDERPPYWRKNLAERQLLLSQLHISPETAVVYFEAVKEFGARALETFPTGALYLAKLALEQGIDAHFDYVLTSSEAVPSELRDVVTEAFSCEIVDHYGQAERVSFGMECSEHDGLHLTPEYGVTELVEPEEAAPAGLLEIVGTPFINYAMPLVRYRTGDLARPMTGPCACGRAMPRIEPIETRAGANVLLADGRCVGYLALTRVFGMLKRIRKSQIVQRELDRFLVRIVRGEGFSDEDAESVRAGLWSLLGSDITVDIEFVDDVPRERSGKLRWFVSELEGESGDGQAQ